MLQAQLAAATVQQEVQQRLQQARKAMVRTAPRTRTWALTSATPCVSYNTATIAAAASGPTVALAAAATPRRALVASLERSVRM